MVCTSLVTNIASDMLRKKNVKNLLNIICAHFQILEEKNISLKALKMIERELHPN